MELAIAPKSRKSETIRLQATFRLHAVQTAHAQASLFFGERQTRSLFEFRFIVRGPRREGLKLERENMSCRP
jgi:hypothetical protein